MSHVTGIITVLITSVNTRNLSALPVCLGIKVENVAEGAHGVHQVEVGQHHTLQQLGHF